MSEELGLKYKKEKRATNLKRDSQEQKAKIKRKNPKMQATQMKKTPRIFPASMSWRIHRNVDSVHRLQVAVT
jgi:hypothetical protein